MGVEGAMPNHVGLGAGWQPELSEILEITDLPGSLAMVPRVWTVGSIRSAFLEVLMKLALLRCSTLPEPDMDEAPTLAACRAAGIETELVNWDEPDAEAKVEAGGFDLCVIRATWDYLHHPERFVAWLERAHERSRVANPPEVVRWNIHKRYLAEIADAGIDVVQTSFFTKGDSIDLQAVVADRGWERFVVKPSISCGSFMTRWFDRARTDDAQRFLDDILTTRDAMVQRFEPRVEQGGERCLVWIDGELTHAIRKQPRFDDDEESVESCEISSADRELAERVLSVAPKPLLYARVDVFEGEDGAPMLSELELIEPSLFFPFGERGLERFVDAAQKWAVR